ncbi:cadherin-like beta sandwich domain-containing protein [Candidatus Poriferisodalis sp.]|uniref:cadherin-like beta sandwich domain-containing protein n=1 Tax=Candidatus Poriferisodalis sp. TaxID=3101277 RepID=UPI003B023148
MVWLVAVAVAAGVLVPVGSGGAGAQEPAAFSRLPDAELDTLAAAGNEYPSALWSDGATLWVADLVEDKVFAYDLATGVRRPGDDVDSLRGAGNTYPMGMWSDGSVLWVSDGADAKVYAYDLATGAHLPFLGIETLDEAGNNWPRGLWSDGSTLWVADYWDGRVYAYDLATGERRPDDDVDSPDAAGNDRPTGLWSDGSTLWVADMADDKVYAYDFSTGARRPGGDFDTLAVAGNGRPAALWSDGSTLWVADSGKSSDDGESRLFAYRMPDSALLRSLSLSGVDFGVFSAGRFSYSVRVPSATTQTTVAAAAAAGSGASVVIAPADADSSTDGHQVDLSPGANAITVTVTNGTLTETYNVAVERSSLGAVDDDASLSALSLSGVDIGTFDAADRRYEAVVPSTVASATVTATPTDADASVNITPADANSDPDDGHQVALGAGANNVAVTVTSSDLTVSAVYTVRVTQVDAPAVTDDASLSALTVAETDTDTAVGIGTFSADAYSYAAAVDSSVGSVTLAATPADPHASVTVTPGDADTATDGHQVSLAAGASTAVTVTVVSSDLSATAQYTISVGRAYTDGVIRLDPDTTPVASMWSDGDVLWVTGPDWVHAYDLDTGARQTDRDFRLTHVHDIHGDDLNAGRFEGGGLWGDGENLYALEGLYGGLYAYDPATGARRPAYDRNGTRPNRPSPVVFPIADYAPEGIWSDGTNMWIADSEFSQILVVDLTTGNYRHGGRPFSTIGSIGGRFGNRSPRDVWSDGEIMWVLDDDDDRIYAYAYDWDYVDRRTSFEIGTLGRVGNDDPAAIWSDGDTMWVLDSEDLIVYPYPMAPRARLASLSFTDVSFRGLRPRVDTYKAAADNTVSATTVAAAATESDATVTVSPADADSNTDGHQVDLSLGSNTVTVTVTLGTQVRTYTVNVVKHDVATLSSDASLSTLSFSDASTFNPDECPCNAQVDNDVTQTTITAAATDPNATVTVWPYHTKSDAGYQMGLAEGGNRRFTITVVSSDLSTTRLYTVNIHRPPADRLPKKSTGPSLRGLWSDGEVIWAAEQESNTLFAYDLETLARLPDRDFGGLESGHDTVVGLWSEGDIMWVAVTRYGMARAYELSTWEYTSNRDVTISWFTPARPAGLWSDGTTMWYTDRKHQRIFAVDPATNQRVGAKDILGLGRHGNDTPGDPWSDTVTMWVPDYWDSKLYAYELATGDRQPQRDVEVRGPNGAVVRPQGVWSDGHTMWVTDHLSDSIVTVDAPVSTLLTSLALSGVDFGMFDQGTRDYSATVAATVSSATLTYEAFDPEAEVVVSPADADTVTDGHQVGLAEGANTVTVTVTAPDGTATVYTVTVERAAASPPPDARFVPGEDLAVQKQSEVEQSEEQAQQQSEVEQSEAEQSEVEQSEVEGQGESESGEEPLGVLEQRVLAPDEVGSVVVSSGAPGELSVSWGAPGLAPFGYRVMWAREDLGYLSYWQADETHRGNVWPEGDATSVTLTGLEEGAVYKVQIRARFRSLGGKVSASPWTGEVTAVVSSSPVARQQAGELGSDEQQADEPETETDESGSGLPALTASFEELPDAHSGAGTDLVVRVRFSEPLAVSYVTMRDGGGVFVQSPHRVVRAKRVEGRSDLWDITIRVGDDRRLSVTVFKGSGCDGEHAVCTADGRPVSQAAQVFIEGPSS